MSYGIYETSIEYVDASSERKRKCEWNKKWVCIYILSMNISNAKYKKPYRLKFLCADSYWLEFICFVEIWNCNYSLFDLYTISQQYLTTTTTILGKQYQRHLITIDECFWTFENHLVKSVHWGVCCRRFSHHFECVCYVFFLGYL